MPEMGPLVNSTLNIIVQALAQNLTVTNNTVRQQGDRLFDLLEEVVVTESRGNTNALLQPIVGCLSQPQNKVAKSHLVDRLSSKSNSYLSYLVHIASIVFSYCAFLRLFTL